MCPSSRHIVRFQFCWSRWHHSDFAESALLGLLTLAWAGEWLETSLETTPQTRPEMMAGTWSNLQFFFSLPYVHVIPSQTRNAVKLQQHGSPRWRHQLTAATLRSGLSGFIRRMDLISIFHTLQLNCLLSLGSKSFFCKVSKVKHSKDPRKDDRWPT